MVQVEVAKSIDNEEYDKLLFASPELNKGAHHLLDSDPDINLYNLTGFSMLPNIVATNLNLKEYIQEFIEGYVAELVNKEDEEDEEDKEDKEDEENEEDDEMEPEITDMMINLPLDEIREYLQDYKKLKEKVIQAKDVRNQLQ